VDGFNTNLGSFGYVYYQNRVISTNFDPRILFVTYYNNLTSTQSNVLRYRVSDGALLETDNMSLDSTGLKLGTNSVSGITVITQSYYPSLLRY
jgi:hypothetical protein